MHLGKAFVLGLVALPVFAFACPDLKGSYKCSVSGFTKAVNVSQAERGGSTVYQVDNGGDIIADGVRHQTPTLHPVLDKYARNYSYVANCGANDVKFDGVADLVRGGQGKVDGELVKQGKNLKIRMHLVTPTDDNNLLLDCVP